jgi:hypothetical protein
MPDLYSVVPGIQVSENELLEAQLIASQILQAKYPDLDLREGTALYDLVIRPNATLMAMLNKALNFYFVQNTIAGVNNETSQEVVDSILSNWFLTRKIGIKAVVNARLFFARQKDVTLSTDIFFSPDNTLKYFPLASVLIPKNQLILDTFENEYYFDVDLVAENEGKDYDLSTGSLLYFSNFDPFFLHAEINFLKSVAVDTETNNDFIERAQTAISTRNLINVPSIISKMLEDFSLLEGVTPIGFGDAEMIRDQIYSYVPSLTPPTTLIHTGGKVDVYSRVPLTTGIVQLTTDGTGKAELSGPVYEFSRSAVSGSEVDDTIAFVTAYTTSNKYALTKTLTSLTSASTTATGTCSSHGIGDNRWVKIAGATPSAYNGWYKVTVTGNDTFTYTFAGGSSPATGTITATFTDPINDFGFSNYQTQIIDFGGGEANKTASFSINYFQDIDGLQDYLEDPSRRVLCADYLARGYNIYLLSATITAYNGPAPDSEVCEEVIKTYLKGLAPGQIFVLADLTAALNAEGIVTIKTPITVTYRYFHRDLITVQTGSIADVLDPKDRTSLFILESITTNNQFL